MKMNLVKNVITMMVWWSHSLVVRPLLAVPMVKRQEEWQHTSIFCTCISCHQRLCTGIIDEDGSLNIALQELVEKLNLKIGKYPNPFWVAWINNTSILVSFCCLVTFLFGKDFEECMVWVLLMKVSHILLGRPWFFDRRVQYDGFENTYTLIHNELNKILSSMKEVLLVKKPEETQQKKVLTMHWFEKERWKLKLFLL